MNPSNERGFVIAPRFCGPPFSGNGGYVSGRFASFLKVVDGAVEITLRSPPPLGVRLDISATEEGALTLHRGETLVAQAKSGRLTIEPPAPAALDEAAEAAQRYAGRHAHPFPTCFVCGLDRASGDGMRLEPGSIGASRVAAAWRPDDSLRSTGNSVAAEFAWAALDCPGGWATDLGGRPMVLGRMTARLWALPEIGRPYVIVGQLRNVDGRKAFTSSAVYSPDAELLGHAEATWLAVDPASVRPASEPVRVRVAR